MKTNLYTTNIRCKPRRLCTFHIDHRSLKHRPHSPHPIFLAIVAMQALRCATFGIQLPRLTPAPSSASTRCQAQQVGDKVLPLIRQPQDILFLGPRIALGALLSTSQNLERLYVFLLFLSTSPSTSQPTHLTTRLHTTTKPTALQISSV